MTTVRITESRDPVTDPPPSGLAVLALTRHAYGGEWKYRRIRAMRLDRWHVEAEPLDDRDFWEWREEDDQAFFPAGWYEATAHAVNLIDCDGPILIPMEGEAEVIAWMELPRFAQQDEVPA